MNIFLSCSDFRISWNKLNPKPVFASTTFGSIASICKSGFSISSTYSQPTLLNNTIRHSKKETTYFTKCVISCFIHISPHIIYINVRQTHRIRCKSELDRIHPLLESTTLWLVTNADAAHSDSHLPQNRILSEVITFQKFRGFLSVSSMLTIDFILLNPYFHGTINRIGAPC